MATKVIFRKFKEGDVIALFPELAGTNNAYQTCLSYQHIWHHSSASLGIMRTTKEAKPNEYLTLLGELKQIYGDIEVVKRFSRKALQIRLMQV